LGRLKALWITVAALTVPLTVPAGTVGVPGAHASSASGYNFTPIAFLGDPAPGGGQFIVDFEPWEMNSRGDVAFAADLTTGGEGIFRWTDGQLTEILRSGDPAPGGGTFEGVVLADTSINDRGDVSVPFTLSPFSFPLGLNAGLYRYSAASRSLEAVVVPDVTLAPGGGTFSGVHFRSSIGNAGQIAFAGLIATDDGIRIPGQDYVGLGAGLFLADEDGQVVAVVGPADPAPGGGVFDMTSEPTINDRGDIAFDGHVAGEECIDFGVPQALVLGCAAGAYVWSSSGGIRAIAREGDPAPGGGTIRWAGGGKINDRGEIAFLADLTPAPGIFENTGVFLSAGGTIAPVVRPGDPLPGGGNAVTSLTRFLNYDLNDRGDVTFHAILDSDDNSDGIPDSGLYLWSDGAVRLVLRTGSVIPGVGTVAHVVAQALGVGSPLAFGAGTLNNRGQVVCQVTLDDGQGALLLASPGA